MLCFGKYLFSSYVSLDFQNFKVTVDQNLWKTLKSFYILLLFFPPCPLLVNTKLKARNLLYFFHSCLRAKVNWALGSITTNKASRGDEIPVELFQFLKDDAVNGLHSVCQQIWKTQQWLQDWKSSVFTPVPKKGNAKECSNYCTITLIAQASKVILKILQARHQQYVNHELPDVQPGFRKGRGTGDQIANIHWIIKKAREFQKKKSALLTMPKPLTVWITIKCGKFQKRWGYQTT